MKKILFCNIPMKANTEKCVYVSEDLSVPVSNTPVKYPVNAFFEKTLKTDDEVKVILLVKKDEFGNYKKNPEVSGRTRKNLLYPVWRKNLWRTKEL